MDQQKEYQPFTFNLLEAVERDEHQAEKAFAKLFQRGNENDEKTHI